VSVEEAEGILHEAAKLKMPTFVYRSNNGGPPVTSSREKIERLEDFLLKTARWRGHLEEQRLIVQSAVRDLQIKWDHMTGWQEHRREGEKTVASVNDAKRIADPDLHDSIKKGEFIVKRLSDQIRRLEHDDEVASRAYTFITGGA
jgi:hypothetical protein